MKTDAQPVLARTRGVTAQVVGDETIVYDLDNDEAHLLNPSVAEVWGLCDGRTVEQLLGAVDMSSIALWESLDLLQKARLLEYPVMIPVLDDKMSRRSLLKKMGVAAVAIPVITTILTPSPAAAVTCTGSCTSNTQCLSGCVCRIAAPRQCITCTPAGVRPPSGNCNAGNVSECCNATCQSQGDQKLCG